MASSASVVYLGGLLGVVVVSSSSKNGQKTAKNVEFC